MNSSIRAVFAMVYKEMTTNLISMQKWALMPNILTPHLLTELAGLSEDLLKSYRDSWGFADEGC